MGKKHKYRGYVYFATNNFIEAKVQRFDKERTELRPVYHIEGLKDASQKPFLTSMSQCRNYIDCHVWRQKNMTEGGDGNA